MRAKQKSDCDRGVLHLRDACRFVMSMPYSGSPASGGELCANESQATTWDDYVADNLED